MTKDQAKQFAEQQGLHRLDDRDFEHAESTKATYNDLREWHSMYDRIIRHKLI